MITTLAEARENLPALWDKATQDREIIFLERSGAEDIALIAADELRSLMETAHLLRCPANARRLLTALQRARSRTELPQTVNAQRAE